MLITLEVLDQGTMEICVGMFRAKFHADGPWENARHTHWIKVLVPDSVLLCP
jgi:hypothetical protein